MSRSNRMRTLHKHSGGLFVAFLAPSPPPPHQPPPPECKFILRAARAIIPTRRSSDKPSGMSFRMSNVETSSPSRGNSPLDAAIQLYSDFATRNAKRESKWEYECKFNVITRWHTCDTSTPAAILSAPSLTRKISAKKRDCSV